jgi:cyanophycinase-like exopeptidase
MLDVERALLAGQPPRYVQIATAAAPEGESSLERWRRLGQEQADRLGVSAHWLPVVDRRSADDPAVAEQVLGAGLIYLSGGNPAFLATTLRDTAVWQAIVDTWSAGASLAGCSAGAMAMTSWIPSIRRPGGQPTQGLGLLSHLRVIPHFDKMLGWAPDLLTRTLLHAPDGTTVLGIDEDTAAVGGPRQWVVHGRQSVFTLGHGHRVEHAPGETIET